MGLSTLKLKVQISRLLGSFLQQINNKYNNKKIQQVGKSKGFVPRIKCLCFQIKNFYLT